ncbi:hexosaminidase [Cryptococcus gattii E566]|uniref:Beta-hexosaminidase n=1 Tax=Cryptococcus gattii EJB2 TaxID=1296103 RepID=A0ABR5C567_9TREE|nr:hexosaminidase [Cryptococcus gattii EJB2]KIY32255.1 hexosaminidase [Cryptococcus gattii E566]
MLFNGLLEAVFSSLPFLAPSSRLSAKPDINLVPLPARYTVGDGSTPLCLSTDFSIQSASSSSAIFPSDLQEAIASTRHRLRNTQTTYLSTTEGLEFFTDSSGAIRSCAYYLDTLYIDLTVYNGTDIHSETIAPVEERAELEAYKLDLPLKGKAIITSRGALGAFRGLTTFEGLFYSLETEVQGSKRVHAPFAPYHIEDKPSFGWRAVLLDSSRHYFSVPAILKVLDTMAMVKLNVFHWHITDSNSWPLDLDSYPELAVKGAYSRSERYSQKEVQMIIDYAAHRGIDTLLEIDTPGHTASIAPSHPSFVACFESTPFKHFAHQPPAGQLRFADDEVTEWTAQLLQEVSSLSKGRYFSTGGDEINVNCMLEDLPTTSALKARGWTLDDALDHFTKKTHAPLRHAGKTPVVWQEMVLNHGKMSSLTNDTIVDIWVNSADARKVLDQGYRIVHASADYFYLDCGQGGWIGEEGGGNSWCDPMKSWARMYSFDPFKDVKDEERHLILGGQTSLWTEQTDEMNLEPTLWPRAAALAEVFWSGPGPDGRPRSANKALSRMHDIRYRMVERGVRAAPLQPHWCALRPGACVLGA